MKPTRILMNEADASPGGGSAPITPEAPKAQGAGITREDLAQLADIIATKTRDQVFADLRKNGVLESKKAKAQAQPSQDVDQPAPLATADIRSLDRAISRSGRDLSDKQVARMELAFQAEKPSDVGAWVKEYFAEMGVANQPVTNNTNQLDATQTARNEYPASDRGSPPASKVPLNERPILGMTPGDRDALIKQIGASKYRERLNAESKGVRITLRKS